MGVQLKNHGNQPKTMKNHETTLKNHGNQPKTMISHGTNQKPWKTMKLPWKTMETNQKTDILWSKKRHGTVPPVQLISFGPKNVTSLTGGSNWPPLVQKTWRLPTGGSNWPPLVQKTWPLPTGGSNWPPLVQKTWRLPTGGSKWPPLVQKTWPLPTGGSNWLFRCLHFCNTFHLQRNSFGAKNVTSLTGGPTDLLDV